MVPVLTPLPHLSTAYFFTNFHYIKFCYIFVNFLIKKAPKFAASNADKKTSPMTMKVDIKMEINATKIPNVYLKYP